MYHLFVWTQHSGWIHMVSVKKAELASEMIKYTRMYRDVEIFAW